MKTGYVKGNTSDRGNQSLKPSRHFKTVFIFSAVSVQGALAHCEHCVAAWCWVIAVWLKFSSRMESTSLIWLWILGPEAFSGWWRWRWRWWRWRWRWWWWWLIGFTSLFPGWFPRFPAVIVSQAEGSSKKRKKKKRTEDGDEDGGHLGQVELGNCLETEKKNPIPSTSCSVQTDWTAKSNFFS